MNAPDNAVTQAATLSARLMEAAAAIHPKVVAWRRDLHQPSAICGWASPLPVAISQWHYVGNDDRNVPPALVRAALARSPTAHLRVLSGVGHVEGWRQAWPALLREIDGGSIAGAP